MREAACPTHIPFLTDGELDLWRENAKKFYLTDRNHDPNWRNETLLWSCDKMIQFSALDTAGLLAPTPLLVIAGSNRTLRPDWLHQAARQRLGCQPVEVSAGHCLHVCQPETIAGILVRV